ncbi:OmpA family protein [Sphingobacterium kyonggiense]
MGLTYRFKKRDWDKPKETIISYDEKELKNLIARVNQLAKDNDALAKQLAEAEGKTITDIVVEKKVLAAPILVTFEINKSILSNEARVNLGFFAKVIKQGNPDIVYRVTGYADAGTGTSEINERLSSERANAVYKCLVNEFHVSPKQLKVDYKGGVENMYYNDPKLNRAVISIADN